MTQQRNRWKGVKIAIALSALVTTAYGFASGPPAGRTGAPGESTCVQCHVGTLNSGQGSVTIEGVPDNYTPGEEITLTVRVQHPDRRRWGFQLTALDNGNRGVGTFVLVDRNITRIINGTGSLQGRTYVEHTSGGTFAGQGQSAMWEVKWRAPDDDIGRITFYAAGNAANDNDSSSGDNIYTTSVASGSTAPNVIAPKYKKGKILLQANGSNIAAGAMLEVSGEQLAETQSFLLALNASGKKWVVKKSAASTPGGMTVDQVLPAGTTVTLVVRNSDGTTSAPVDLTR